MRLYMKEIAKNEGPMKGNKVKIKRQENITQKFHEDTTHGRKHEINREERFHKRKGNKDKRYQNDTNESIVKYDQK